MIGAVLLLVALIFVGGAIAVAMIATRAGMARSTPPPGTPPPGSTPLDAALARWTSAGLISTQEADGISRYEWSLATAPPPPTAEARMPVTAEALGYLGGGLAAIGVISLVARFWSDLGTASHLALSGAGSLALLGAGFAVRDSADPALGRLRSFLWMLSSAAAALFTVVLVRDLTDTEDSVVLTLAASAAVALHSGLLWRGAHRPAQQFVTLASGLVAIGCAVGVIAAPDAAQPAGLAIWIGGLALLVIGLRHRIPSSTLTVTVGAVAMTAGALLGLDNVGAPSLLFATFTALGLFALVTCKTPFELDPSHRTAIGIVAGFAALQAIPATIGHFADEAGAATGIVVWLAGGVLVLAGFERLVRTATALEVVGSFTMVLGAAVVGVEWPGVAPIFGLVTALGLLTLGTLPRAAVVSFAGALGLLVNVPWAIGRWLPGEARTPVLILVSGALILVLAVLLGRLGPRFRHEFGHESA